MPSISKDNDKEAVVKKLSLNLDLVHNEKPRRHSQKDGNEDLALIIEKDGTLLGPKKNVETALLPFSSKTTAPPQMVHSDMKTSEQDDILDVSQGSPPPVSPLPSKSIKILEEETVAIMSDSAQRRGELAAF